MKWTQRDWSDRLARGLWADDAAAARLHALLAGHTVILASASPRRRAILRQCRVRFRVWTHTLDEPLPQGPDWRGWVRRWAWRKAADAAAHQRHGLVIAADTIVVQGRHGLGKPRSHAQARAMLRSLSGRTHQVYTGVAVINVTAARHAAGSAVSYVHFRRLSDREIAGYIRSGEPADKAGAYAIQGGGGQFVDRIAGPLDNIIGLPVGCLSAVLARVLR